MRGRCSGLPKSNIICALRSADETQKIPINKFGTLQDSLLRIPSALEVAAGLWLDGRGVGRVSCCNGAGVQGESLQALQDSSAPVGLARGVRAPPVRAL